MMIVNVHKLSYQANLLLAYLYAMLVHKTGPNLSLPTEFKWLPHKTANHFSATSWFRQTGNHYCDIHLYTVNKIVRIILVYLMTSCWYRIRICLHSVSNTFIYFFKVRFFITCPLISKIAKIVIQAKVQFRLWR